MGARKQIKGIGEIDVFDYGQSRVTISFKIAGKEWTLSNDHYFSSPGVADNQIKNVCDKLGISLRGEAKGAIQ